MDNTALNKDDILHLTHLNQTNKLPGLGSLMLPDSNASQMEDEFSNLLEACVIHHEKDLWLSLTGKNLSQEFMDKWERCCEGTSTRVNFGSTQKTEKFSKVGEFLAFEEYGRMVQGEPKTPGVLSLTSLWEKYKNKEKGNDESMTDVSGAWSKTNAQNIPPFKPFSQIDLSGNSLTDGGHLLVKSIQTWEPDTPLQVVNLRDCNVPEDVCVELVTSLQTCKSLTHLGLSGNNLVEAGRYLADSIRS